MMAYPGTQLIPAFRKALKIFIEDLIIFRQLDKNVLFRIKPSMTQVFI